MAGRGGRPAALSFSTVQKVWCESHQAFPSTIMERSLTLYSRERQAHQGAAGGRHPLTPNMLMCILELIMRSFRFFGQEVKERDRQRERERRTERDRGEGEE